MDDWHSVRAALLCEGETSEGGGSGGGGGGGVWPFFLSPLEQHRILKAQSNTKHLDCLMYTLISKTTHIVSKQ